ncbi:MAG: flagellar basal body rod protein FlgC, partial [Alphaproteobacteria bacterium]|nr:flagellar basal body rod protein FlgC [Alphaproteobacteria bacterium]
MDQLFDTLTTSAYGMRAQGERTRMISENIANSNTAANEPGQDPYTRKVITFKNELDRTYGQKLVKVEDITEDRPEEFPLKYMADHPGADANGYVRMPNVNMLIEVNDMREAQRSYE